MLHIFSPYNQPSSITASLLISLPLQNASTEFWAGKLHNNRQPPHSYASPSLTVLHRGYTFMYWHLHSFLHSPTYKDPRKLLKTPRKWNQWDGDESVESILPPALTVSIWVAPAWRQGVRKRAHFGLVFWISACIFPYRSKRSTKLMSQTRERNHK